MTTTILQIFVSPRATSISRRVAREIAERIVAQRPGTLVIERDLATDPPPHPDLELYEAILSPTPDDDPRFALSEQLIGELEAADFVVIGTPMNNFTAPSTLKAWIDHIVRIRRTFHSTPGGRSASCMTGRWSLSARMVVIAATRPQDSPTF
jgi:FMN-dependent NADH-azoreductase